MSATAEKPAPKPAKKRKRKKTAAAVAPNIRDRILEFRRVPAGEILDNERNWRTHPVAQKKAIEEVLEQIGIAGALTGYYSERNGGQLTLIDGHERRSHQADWPVLILDVNDEEADMLLATFDPIGALAGVDADAVTRLLDDLTPDTVALTDLLQTLRGDAATLRGEEEAELAENAVKRGERAQKVLPEMELQPFEHYDYVVLLCRNTYDWMALQDALGIEQVQFTAPNGAKLIGRGRVVDATKVLEMLGAQAEPEKPGEHAA